MKKHFSKIYSLLVLALLFSCKQDANILNADQYSTVYMAQAESLRDFIFQQSLGSDKIFVGASYGGLDYAPADINVQFEADLSLVTTYNDTYGTDYLPLPLSNISFPQKETIIKKGELQSAPLMIDVDFEGLPTFTSYLLPVKITSISGNIPLKEELKTAYFRVEIRSDPTPVKIMMLGKGGGNKDVAKLAQIIRDANPDIVLIREVDSVAKRSDFQDFPNELLNLIELKNFLYVPSIARYGDPNPNTGESGKYGMAVYTKYPMSNAKTYRLVANGANQGDNAERGPFAVMDLNVNGKSLKLAAVHTNTNVDARAIQLGEIIEIVGEDDGLPFVLIGNMNVNPNGGDSYAALSGIGFGPACTTCPPNFSVANPASWSDMTLFRPSGRFSVVSHSVGNAQQVIGGTHLPVFTTLNVYF